MAKRFKITASGKILRSKAGRRHLLSCKTAKQKRNLAKRGLVADGDMAKIKLNLPFS